MASERLIHHHGGGPRHHQAHVEPLSPLSAMMSSLFSFGPGHSPEPSRIFEELPKATIISVSRPDAADFSPILFSYTIEFSYKQFKWQLVRKASDLFYLHFALKRRLLFEEIYEKQEQVKEWLQNLGIGDHTHVDQEDDALEHDAVPLHHDESAKNRDVPSSAALPVMKPALLRLSSMSDRAKVTMQEYLNHFLGNLDIVNSREVWAVLKPGFLAFLEDPFDTRPLDIMVFDVLPLSDGPTEGRVSLAVEVKERNPLRHAFKDTRFPPMNTQ